MNSEKKKNNLSFNIIDVALIIIALSAISAIVFFLSNNRITKGSSSEKVSIEYTLQFKEIREEYKNLIEIGDTITESTKMAKIGEVINVIYTEALYSGINSDGETVTTPYTGRITVTVKVKTTAVKTKSGYVINGYDLFIGNDMNVRMPNYTGDAKCIAISTDKK